MDSNTAIALGKNFGFFVLLAAVTFFGAKISLKWISKDVAKWTGIIGGAGFVLLGIVLTVNMWMPGTIPGIGAQGYQPTPIQSGGTTPPVILTASPTITLRTPDVYNPGTAIVSQNKWRFAGAQGWTDIAGAGTITTAAAGSKIQVVAGIDSNDESAEPYGPIVDHTVEYMTSYELTIPVANDALATDLAVYYTNEIGQVNTNMTLGAGDIDTAKITWVGSYEEDFGNRFCGDKNVIVVRYNTTSIDDVTLSNVGGTAYARANVPVIHGSSSGYTDKAYYFPVLKSNAEYPFLAVVNADDTIDPITVGVDDLTFSLYDVALYYDNNTNEDMCGIEDENNAEIGATAADTLDIQYG